MGRGLTDSAPTQARSPAAAGKPPPGRGGRALFPALPRPAAALSLHQCGPLTLLCLLPELRKHRSCWGLDVYSYFLSIVQLLIPVGAQSSVLSVIHRWAPVCLSLSLRKARGTVTTGARIQLKWEMGKDQNRAEATGLYSGVEI